MTKNPYKFEFWSPDSQTHRGNSLSKPWIEYHHYVGCDL